MILITEAAIQILILKSIYCIIDFLVRMQAEVLSEYMSYTLDKYSYEIHVSKSEAFTHSSQCECLIGNIMLLLNLSYSGGGRPAESLCVYVTDPV